MAAFGGKMLKNEGLPTVNYNNHSMFIIINRDTVDHVYKKNNDRRLIKYSCT